MVGRAPEGFPTWTRDEQIVAFVPEVCRPTGLRTTVGLGAEANSPRDGRLASQQHNKGLFAGVGRTGC